MDKTLSLLCVVEDPAISPSSRLRIFQHLDALKTAGITVEVMLQPKRGESWAKLLKKARTVDAVLWQKVLMSQWNVLRLRVASKRLLFDLDDAVWMGKKNHVPYRSGKQARRFGFLMRFLDGAICGSPYLEQKIQSSTPKLKTRLIPTSVPSLASSEFRSERTSGELPVVVWVGMGPNIAQVEAMEAELLAAHTEHPFLLRIVSNRPPLFRQFTSWEFIEWSEKAEYDSIAYSDLGIMPLVDDGFTRGKCAYKALQYMACGLPVVASDVGVNREWIEESGSGFVVKPSGWPSALVQLLSDPALRTKMGESGWKTVQERFTHERVGTQLAAFFCELISSQG
jgi:glycosyltransferase involved in cell wall biosynthesis